MIECHVRLGVREPLTLIPGATGMADDKEFLDTTPWGDRTMRRKLSAMEKQLIDQGAEILADREHIETVAEAKVVVKWIRWILLGITTVAGAVVAVTKLELW
jgi:hypothetical protein